MLEISDDEFSKIISDVMDELPKQYIEKLNNVAIVYEDEPTPEQRKQLKLRCGQSLFGLYQGIPLTSRNGNYSLVPPDVITLFKNPILSVSNNNGALRANIKHTLWHEIAHYYGLGHDKIHSIEAKWRS